MTELTRWVQEDPLRYQFLQDFHERGASILYSATDGIVLKRHRIIYAAGTVSDPALFSDTFIALVCELSVRDALLQGGIFRECFPCYQAVYTNGSIPRKRSDILIRQLTLEDMPFVLQNYHHPGANREHIEARIREYMIGAFIDGCCAGFAGIHEEGSIGLIEVLPEYRRRGIAEALESQVINWCIQNGRLPYCHVLTDNTMSLALQRKLNLTLDPKPLYWLS